MSCSSHMTQRLSGVQRHGCVALSSQRAKRRCPVVAALDSSQTIAVSQQLVAFAVLAGGEGVWANQRLRKDNPGRANLPATAACGAVMLLAVALLQVPATQKVGEIVGLVDGAVFMANYILRAIKMPDNAADWPGPKAPLAGMALASFFALSTCLQGLQV